MSNNSHSLRKCDCSSGITQSQIASTLIFDQPCLNTILNYDHILDKCCLCATPYSCTNVPKCLPCTHTICQRCLPEKMGPNTVACGVCNKEYQYFVESNGFLIGSDNCIKIFNDEDELINIGEPGHTSIHDLVNEEYSKWLTSVNQLIKEINNDEIKVVNKDSIPKSIMVKEFSYKYPSQKKAAILNIEEHAELQKAATMRNMDISNDTLYIDKYHRSIDSVIVQNKSKCYKLDLGHDIDSILELLYAVNSNCKPSPVQEKTYSPKQGNAKKRVNNLNNTTNTDTHNSIINKMSDVQQCTDSIDPKTKRDRPNKSMFKEIATLIYSPMERILLTTSIKLKEKDKVVPNWEIVDGQYAKIATTLVKLDIPKRFLICFNCFTSHNDKPYTYDDIISLSITEIKKYQSTHFCPTNMIGLCLKHALKHKIKYPDLNLFSIESKKEMDRQYSLKPKKISELLLCLMKSQYALTFDRLKIPIEMYLPHKR